MKLESSLPEKPTGLLLAPLLDLVLVLGIILFSVVGLRVSAGVEVELPGSRYRLDPYERPILVTVSGGEDPGVFVAGKRLEPGESLAEALRKRRDEVAATGDVAKTVVLRLDAGVSAKRSAEIEEIVLGLGFTAAREARPIE